MPFPPNIMQILGDIEADAGHLIAQPSHEGEVRVIDGDGWQYIVNLRPDWKCTCGDFQDFMYPCVHAWRAITKLRYRHHDYVSPYIPLNVGGLHTPNRCLPLCGMT